MEKHIVDTATGQSGPVEMTAAEITVMEASESALAAKNLKTQAAEKLETLRLAAIEAEMETLIAVGTGQTDAAKAYQAAKESI